MSLTNTEGYSAICCRLDTVFTDSDCERINDLVERVHQITTAGYFLAKDVLLQKLEEEQNADEYLSSDDGSSSISSMDSNVKGSDTLNSWKYVNSNFFRECLLLLTECKMKEGSAETLTNSYRMTIRRHLASFEKNYHYSKIQLKSPGQVMQYEANRIVTAYTNTIKMHLEKHLLRAINQSLKPPGGKSQAAAAARKAFFTATRKFKQILSTAATSAERLQAAASLPDVHRMVFENMELAIFKFLPIRTLKTKEKKRQTEQTKHTMHTEHSNPNGVNMTIANTTKKKKKKKKKKKESKKLLKFDIEHRPERYLMAMVALAKYAKAHNIHKTLTIPVRKSMIPCATFIDFRIFCLGIRAETMRSESKRRDESHAGCEPWKRTMQATCSETDTDDEQRNRRNSKGRACRPDCPGNPLVLWKDFIKFESRIFRRKGRIFSGLFSTDGCKVTILYRYVKGQEEESPENRSTEKATETKKPSPKSRANELELTLDNWSTKDREESRGRVIVIDPNHRDLLYILSELSTLASDSGEPASLVADDALADEAMPETNKPTLEEVPNDTVETSERLAESKIRGRRARYRARRKKRQKLEKAAKRKKPQKHQGIQKFRYTYCQDRRESGLKEYSLMERGLVRDLSRPLRAEYHSWMTELSSTNTAAVDLQEFRSSLQIRGQANTFLFPFYFKKEFREARWMRYRKRQQADDNLANALRSKFGDDVIILMGNYNNSTKKYHAPSRKKGFRDLFRKKGFDVVLLDEFRTSYWCPKCNHRVKATKYRENPRPLNSKQRKRKSGLGKRKWDCVQDPKDGQTEDEKDVKKKDEKTGKKDKQPKMRLVHGLLECQNKDCLPGKSRLWNRDVLACLNFIHILNGYRENDERPARFCRESMHRCI